MSVQNLSSNERLPAVNDVLTRKLNAAAWRIRLVMLVKLCSHALCYSSLACLLWVGLSKLRLIAEPSHWVLGGVILFALSAVAVYVATRKLTQLDVAKLTDRRTDLKERLSSAVEFRSQGFNSSSPFHTQQISDALLHAGSVDLKAAYPIIIPKQFWAGIVASLALFGMFFLPSLPIFWSKEKKQEAEEVKKQGVQIIKVAKDATKAAGTQDLKETKKAAEEAKKLGEAMQKAKMTKKESLVALEKLTRKMEETQKKLAEQQTRNMDKAKKAGADFKKSLDKMEKEIAEKKADEAKKLAQEAKNAPKKPVDPNAQKNPTDPKQSQPQTPQMKQAMQAMQQMAEALANLDKSAQQKAMQKIAEQLKSGKMTKQEMKKMQEAIKQLAQNMKDSGQQQQGEQMGKLAQQMQDGLNNMDPNSLQQMAQAASEMAKQLGKEGGEGKDKLDGQSLAELADALKGGRMTMAMGKGMGQGGNMPGMGFGGQGHKTDAMKDPGKTSPRLVAEGKNGQNKGIGKTKAAEEFAKYAAMKSTPSKFLPNGKVKGERQKNGQELQMNFTGDPEAFKSNAAYYSVYSSGKKQAESTLNKENIPPTYKKQVKEYFENIRP